VQARPTPTSPGPPTGPNLTTPKRRRANKNPAAAYVGPTGLRLPPGRNDLTPRLITDTTLLLRSPQREPSTSPWARPHLPA